VNIRWYHQAFVWWQKIAYYMMIHEFMMMIFVVRNKEFHWRDLGWSNYSFCHHEWCILALSMIMFIFYLIQIQFSQVKTIIYWCFKGDDRFANWYNHNRPNDKDGNHFRFCMYTVASDVQWSYRLQKDSYLCMKSKFYCYSFVLLFVSLVIVIEFVFRIRFIVIRIRIACKRMLLLFDCFCYRVSSQIFLKQTRTKLRIGCVIFMNQPWKNYALQQIYVELLFKHHDRDFIEQNI